MRVPNVSNMSEPPHKLYSLLGHPDWWTTGREPLVKHFWRKQQSLRTFLVLMVSSVDHDQSAAIKHEIRASFSGTHKSTPFRSKRYLNWRPNIFRRLSRTFSEALAALFNFLAWSTTCNRIDVLDWTGDRIFRPSLPTI